MPSEAIASVVRTIRYANLAARIHGFNAVPSPSNSDTPTRVRVTWENPDEITDHALSAACFNSNIKSPMHNDVKYNYNTKEVL